MERNWSVLFGRFPSETELSEMINMSPVADCADDDGDDEVTELKIATTKADKALVKAIKKGSVI